MNGKRRFRVRPRRTPRRRCISRGGFSLLEVVLALGILVGSVTVLSAVMQLGLRNAEATRDMTQAQLLCESVLAEVTSGILPAESVQGVEADPYSTEPIRWLYSIELAEIDEDGLIAVRATVYQDLPEDKRPVRFSLVRWMIDPGLETTDLSEVETETDESVETEETE